MSLENKNVKRRTVVIQTKVEQKLFAKTQLSRGTAASSGDLQLTSTVQKW
jgi:hypothetical protein